MTRHRRMPRRQGVVYGPVLDRGQHHPPTLVGRLIGAVVVLGALALMAIVTFAFLGRAQLPGPSPSPSAAAGLSPSPSPSPAPTLPPAPSPSATVAVTPTPSTAPSPTPLEIVVREGPGAVTFGTQNDSDFLVTDPRTEFPRRGRMIWSAHLTEAAGAPVLSIDIVRINPDDGSEVTISTLEQEVENQNAVRFLRRWRIQRLVDAPGIYAVRYIRDGLLLAEGLFRVED